MNGKYLLYSMLIALLVPVTTSFSVNRHELLSYTVGAIAVPTCIYLVYRTLFSLIWLRIAHLYKNVPESTEKWAREALSESHIENAETVLFKEGDQWCASPGFIMIPRDFNPENYSEIESLKGVAALKHEMKHFNNNDSAKRATLTAVTIGTGLFLATNTELPIIALPGLVALGYGIDKIHTRYQEQEADRFACEKTSSNLELAIHKGQWIRHSKIFEEMIVNFYDNCSSHHNFFDGNSIQKKILSSISYKLKSFDQSEISSAGNDKKRMLFKAAFFALDQDHPYPRDRADNVQKFIDEREKKSQLSSILALQ